MLAPGYAVIPDTCTAPSEWYSAARLKEEGSAMSKHERPQLTGEEGHAVPALLALVGGAGAVAVGIGVAADSDALAIAGGIGAAIGIFGGALAAHMTIDYDIYKRLEDLEKK